MTARVFAMLAILLLLGSCGGGGGGPTVSIPPPPEPEPTPQPPPPPPPPEPEPEPEPETRTPPPEPPATLTREALPPTAAELLSYLQIHASGGPWYSGDNREATWRHAPGLARFSSPPTLRIAEGTSDLQRATILHAVAMVNRALPHEGYIRIGTDAPAGAAMVDVPDGEIFVDFALHRDWKPRPDPEFLPTGQAAHRFAIEGGKKVGHQASHIWLDARLDPGGRIVLSTMVHELLHALGLGGHVSPTEYPDSFLRETLPPSDTDIDAMNVAALQVLYLRLGTATAPEDLSIASLGPWDAETVLVSGTIGDVSFGVRRRNGISVPWTDGDQLARPLAENRGLRGTATWNGQIVGFTPDQDTVSGKAEISVTLAAMSGRAEFSELQSWPGGTAPGALGTGARWKTGSLGYAISVTGPYIRSTGVGAGELSGNFYGSDHEGVAGTLDRRDLTAAFGASRRSAQ